MNLDQLHRFLLENRNVRGQIVTLSGAIASMLEIHDYPAPIADALTECALAVSLMSTSLKYEGKISIRTQGKGMITLLMVECTNTLKLRGLAQWQSDIDPANLKMNSLSEMLGDEAKMVITIEPDEGERYQGIVEVSGDTLASSLENYFDRSEQLPTRFWLSQANGIATGLLLQKLPNSEDDHDWRHVITLADTIKQDELITLPHGEILRRLFHEEDLRLYDPHTASFHCSCSRDRLSSALVSLGRAELDSILAERSTIDIDCEFCRANYRFDSVDVAALFTERLTDNNITKH